MSYHLYISSRKDKKLMIINPAGKKIHFGDNNYSDYTIHKDKDRRNRYLLRHNRKEDWSIEGINTAGFWSKHLLWNKQTLKQSIRDIQERFKIKIVL